MMIKRIATWVSLLTLVAGCGDPPEYVPVPAAMEARIEPARLWYHSGQDVLLAATVTDVLGDTIDTAIVEWRAEPASGATMSATPPSRTDQMSYTLGTEREVTFTGCVVFETASAIELCDSIRVRIDDGSPSLEVTSPLPGAELDAAEGIVVQGSVVDRGDVRVVVNGMAAEVDEMGAFTATMAPTFGVNHLTIEASDGITEVPAVEMDVLWATGYTPAVNTSGTPELNLPDGIALWLGQDFFDNEVPLDMTAMPVTTEDLADILELVISSLDLGGVIPDPVVDMPPTFTMRIPSARLSQTRAELDVRDDGIDLFMRIGQIQVTTEGALQVDTTMLPLDGGISASAVAFAHLTVQKDGPDAELQVELGDLTLGIESVEGHFTSDETMAIFRLAEGLLRTTLETQLVNALRTSLADTIPVVMRDALTSLDTALSDVQIPIETEYFQPVTLLLDGSIASITTAYRRELVASMQTRVGTMSMPAFPDTRGVARLDTAAMAPPFIRNGSIQVSLRLAVMNALLHSLWNSGMLNVDVTPLLPESVSGLVTDAQMTGRLPPILRPPQAVESYDLLLTVGQLELDMTFAGQPARYGLSLSVGVNLAIMNGQISVNIQETPTIDVWSIQTGEQDALLSADGLRDLLLGLWPDLSMSIRDGLSFDLPIPALGDLGGIAPDLAGLALSLEMADRIRPRGGVLLLDTRLVGTLP